jgi:hypothetical protein
VRGGLRTGADIVPHERAGADDSIEPAPGTESEPHGVPVGVAIAK